MSRHRECWTISLGGSQIFLSHLRWLSALRASMVPGSICSAFVRKRKQRLDYILPSSHYQTVAGLGFRATSRVALEDLTNLLCGELLSY